MVNPSVMQQLGAMTSPTLNAPAHEQRHCNIGSQLGGSWVVISGVISPLIWVISIVTLLITLLRTTHETPSRTRGQHV